MPRIPAMPRNSSGRGCIRVQRDASSFRSAWTFARAAGLSRSGSMLTSTKPILPRSSGVSWRSIARRLSTTSGQM
jgi:hypothetical protein